MTQEKTTAARTRRKTRVGIVSSDKMTKTITVQVKGRKAHPLYGKTIPFTTKFHAHDEKNDAHVGDLVEIMETRPLSKTKNWRLNRVIERAK